MIEIEAQQKARKIARMLGIGEIELATRGSANFNIEQIVQKYKK